MRKRSRAYGLFFVGQLDGAGGFAGFERGLELGEGGELGLDLAVGVGGLRAFSTLAWRFSTVSRSASSSSVLMMSMSCSGLTPPATWTTSGSSKQRTTWQMASVARMWPRNWLPRPSPLRRAFDEAGDVDELHGGGDEAIWAG